MNDDKLEHKDTLYISITHIFNFSALFIWIYRESYMGDQRRKDKLGKKNKENRTTKDQEEQQDGEQDGWDGRGQPGK